MRVALKVQSPTGANRQGFRETQSWYGSRRTLRRPSIPHNARPATTSTASFPRVSERFDVTKPRKIQARTYGRPLDPGGHKAIIRQDKGELSNLIPIRPKADSSAQN